MIRSGLTNVRKGGGFEEGYSHQFDARKTTVIRPYVTTFDTGIGKPSDYSTIVPLPISYEKIFSKALTPSEKVYLAKQVRRGAIRKDIRKLKPYEKQPEIEIDPVNSSDSKEGDTIVSDEKDRLPTLEEQLNGVTDSGIDATWSDEYDLRNNLYAEELAAVDVVYPRIHQETFAEQKHAEDLWEKRVIEADMADVVENHSHTKDDIVMDDENNFGANIIGATKTRVKKSKEKSLTAQAISVNGVGPRRRYSQRKK